MLNNIKSCVGDVARSDSQLNLEEICLKEKELSLLSESPIWVRNLWWKFSWNGTYEDKGGGGISVVSIAYRIYCPVDGGGREHPKFSSRAGHDKIGECYNLYGLHSFYFWNLIALLSKQSVPIRNFCKCRGTARAQMWWSSADAPMPLLVFFYSQN